MPLFIPPSPLSAGPWLKTAIAANLNNSVASSFNAGGNWRRFAPFLPPFRLLGFSLIVQNRTVGRVNGVLTITPLINGIDPGPTFDVIINSNELLVVNDNNFSKSLGSPLLIDSGDNLQIAVSTDATWDATACEMTLWAWIQK